MPSSLCCFSSLNNMSLFSCVILNILLFYDFPMTTFRWSYMLDAIFFLQLLKLLFDTIRRYANDLGKLLASSERVRAYLVQYHFLGTFARFLGTARVFLGTFLGSSRIIVLVFFPFCTHNHVSALQFILFSH